MTTIIDPNQPVDYSSTTCPTTYCCHECKATGIKLWREYSTFLNHQTLLCFTCSCKEQIENLVEIDEAGKIQSSIISKSDQIGWRIPAVPTEQNDTYWGYTSVPEPGVQWWKRLPSKKPKA